MYFGNTANPPASMPFQTHDGVTDHHTELQFEVLSAEEPLHALIFTLAEAASLHDDTILQRWRDLCTSVPFQFELISAEGPRLERLWRLAGLR